MSLRGKGLECPVDGEPGLEEADKAGDTEPARCDRLDRVVFVDVLGLVLKVAGLMPGCILMTPAAIPPETGTRTAGGGGGPGEWEEEDKCGE